MDEDTRLFDVEIQLLLEGVFRVYQHDFRNYASASLRRRVRQAMERFSCLSISELQHLVLHDRRVFAQMLQYFTVQLSELYRDPGYFLALRQEVVPVLKTYPSVKVWVAGCSSGEELWSLAILFDEEDLLERTVFYATDINPEALRTAEAGIYPLDRIAQFSSNYREAGGRHSLSDYYVAAYDAAAFDRRLRRQAVFADHSLATDSVFSEVHLVSCRNVLIYFNRSLQDRAIGLFREALVRRGFLGLGSRESLRFTAHADGFEEVVPEHRIYRSK
ncbi:protein-glutamate O-methyltransferase CheR [Schlegelella sp. S2-27]|uniref:Protein-glutamate O-methyltransferase CheR n=1 Tax=Caldimonas mangrovi TaxID=2944811 RepID=A0ABT0YUZ6_9BURK|nr:CheR family methyltransferase [Caldimonas mangrovi]MCM5682567.1 protein-glutamate O-methyltransferase CheR [Caldimonas mangrovi]